jgi:toxin FitB
MYLVDTNVLSAAAPTKSSPSPALVDWMDRNSERLFLSVITIAEIEEGVAKARRQGSLRKADRLAGWLETVLHLYGNQILMLDVPVALLVGRLTDHARGVGQSPGLADLAIAATARFYGYTILTRNLRHFAGLGVPIHDPFEGLPEDAD